jgi:predicted transcriptional regulator YheO
MTEHQTIIANLSKIADSIVTMFGKNCESCIHDLTNLQNSLVYLAGNVTHRQLGAPATDLLIRRLKQNKNNPQDMHNYKTTTNDGRSLKSSSTFIKDSSGKVVAAFCINFDTTDFYNASQALMPLLSITEQVQSDSHETFSHSVEDTIKALFNQGVAEVGRHPTTMSVEEKTRLISYLDENGSFQLKGAVEEVAHLMGVTKFTVYNYLKKVRSHQLT